MIFSSIWQFRNLIFLTAFVFGNASLWAQFQHKGQVFEQNEQGELLPLPFVVVAEKEGSAVAETDLNGKFVLKSTKEQILIVFQLIGYETIELPSNAFLGQVVMKPTQGLLEEVNVVGKQKASYLDFSSAIATQVMTEKELTKAACCNLSESFDTNPSVDVGAVDAVSGVKQIQLLGLSGIYTQILGENMPSARGLSAFQGLGHVPGSWIDQIQVTKGVGSVINGYESMAGQINFELKKPCEKQPDLFLNAYQSNFGRSELNFLNSIYGEKASKFMIYGHTSHFWLPMDGNKDGFLDMPLGSQYNFGAKWLFDHKNLKAQLFVQGLQDEKWGGQLGFREKEKNNGQKIGYISGNKKVSVLGKLGYVFSEKKYKSIGFQFSQSAYQTDNQWGRVTFLGKQNSTYANLIYQTVVKDTRNKIKLGLSLMRDAFDETFMAEKQLNRDELVAGSFFEHTFSPNEKISFVSGLRLDHHNLFGWLLTPRFHLKLEPVEHFSVRLSSGKGFRSANLFTDNQGVWFSNRNVELPRPSLLEASWTSGVHLAWERHFFDKHNSFSLDYFRTDFQQQMVVDREQKATSTEIYAVNGSFSDAFQAAWEIEASKMFDFRLAYRFYEQKIPFRSATLLSPLLAAHKMFFNTGIQFSKLFVADLTLVWNGRKRMPGSETYANELFGFSQSPSFWMVNAQITYKPNKNLELYFGGENLLGVAQRHLVVDAFDTDSPRFDAGMVWGAATEQMVYGGIRWKIFRKKA